MSFTYVKIPADDSEPIVELTADKSGGLTNDALVANAREYFYKLTGAQARSETLQKSNPTQRAAIANQIRQQLSSNQALQDMDDDTVLDMIAKSSVPSCDIMALTIPTSKNNHHAVSLYAADNAAAHGLAINKRAMELVTACGHHTDGIFGDVFVGRAKDDETADIWERVDLTASDADAKAEWCRVARSSGGGGGSGKAAASSLSGLVQQGMVNPNNLQVVDGGAGSNAASTNFGQDGSFVYEPWGSWSQTEDEIELRFVVETNVKAKYCKVNFARQRIKISVSGQTLVQGATFDPIVVDECTYTLTNEGGVRLLCVTLSKAEPRIWSWAVER